MVSEWKILINHFVIGGPHFPGIFCVFRLFFTEISILCQKSKKVNGQAKCDWMRSAEGRVSKGGNPKGESSVSPGSGRWGSCGRGPGCQGKRPHVVKSWGLDIRLAC